jgi:hypothetical protein
MIREKLRAAKLAMESTGTDALPELHAPFLTVPDSSSDGCLELDDKEMQMWAVNAGDEEDTFPALR